MIRNNKIQNNQYLFDLRLEKHYPLKLSSGSFLLKMGNLIIIMLKLWMLDSNLLEL